MSFQPEKTGIAEHATYNLDCKTPFDNTENLSTTSNYYPRPRLYREAIEIAKHHNNFNRQEESLYFSRS